MSPNFASGPGRDLRWSPHGPISLDIFGPAALRVSLSVKLVTRASVPYLGRNIVSSSLDAAPNRGDESLSGHGRRAEESRRLHDYKIAQIQRPRPPRGRRGAPRSAGEPFERARVARRRRGKHDVSRGARLPIAARSIGEGQRSLASYGVRCGEVENILQFRG
jgi:hypothetical protein